MVIADVDGTLLGSDIDLADLLNHLAKRRDVVLIPDSSRPIASLHRSWREARIDGFPTQVGALGTELEVDGSTTGWSDTFAGFDRSPFDVTLTEMGFQTNGDAFQTPLKASYNVPYDRWTEVAAALQAVGPAQVVTSGQFDFDVIPVGAGKAAPIGFLADVLQVSPTQVIAAGDSMNDLTMLMAASSRIVVGNADQALIDSTNGQAYQSRAKFAAGVTEGLQALGVF
jgi:sucrose-phosphate synthase